jgi:hypothetical protein
VVLALTRAREARALACAAAARGALLLLVANEPRDPLDQVHGVGEVDHRLNADDEELQRPDDVPVLHHAAVALCPADEPLDHHVGPGHLQQDLEQREAHDNGEARLTETSETLRKAAAHAKKSNLSTFHSLAVSQTPLARARASSPSLS